MVILCFVLRAAGEAGVGGMDECGRHFWDAKGG